MAALTQDRKGKNRWVGRTLSLPVAANAIPFQGGLVNESATGFAKAASATAGERCMGMSLAKQDNTGGADGAIRVQAQTGVFLLDNDGVNPVVQADLGRPCYVKDDHTVQGIAGGSTVIAGRVEDLDASGGIWVYVAPEVGVLGGADIAPLVDNQAVPGITEDFIFNVPDAADADYDIIVKRKIEVVDVTVLKIGAGAGNTATVQKGAAAISDAIVAAVDKALTRAAQIDTTQSTLNPGDTLRVHFHRAAGLGTCKVIVTCLPR